MAGFDTLWDGGSDDATIVAISEAGGRILLTRDRELLKRRDVTHGCYVRALRPREQLREIFDRLDLARSARPFTRCLVCNAPLRNVDKARIGDRLPPRVRERHQHFTACDGCGRIFWEGSHWQRMRALVDALITTQIHARPDRRKPVEVSLP